MNILVVCQYYYPEPFRITDICEELVKTGHKVTVLTGLPNYPEGVILKDYRKFKKRKEIINGVNVIRCFEIGRGNNKYKLFLNYLSYTISGSLKILFCREKFDVILVNQLSPVLMAIPAILYKSKYKKRILLYCLDLWPASLVAGGINSNSIVYKIFYKISCWIYNSVDKILVTSNMFTEYLNSVIKVNTDKIEYLPQYAEDIFKPEDNIDKDYSKFNFVFAGNIGDMQSVETIILAANELKFNDNIFFHILGDGSKLNECKELAKKLNLQNLKFYGRKKLEDMPYYYGIADAMLVTLKDDNILSYTLPGKVQSYMAFGKPIIGSINGETNKIINENKCGLCCSAEDYKTLSSIIIEFCNTEDRQKMSANALIYYNNNFKKEIFMKKLEYTLINMGE